MTEILLEASFAAAWKALGKARDAQTDAMKASLDVYRAGERGRRARIEHRRAERLRTAYLADALRIRRNIHELRGIRRELETTMKKIAAPAAE